jgi:hypothetical protein
MQSINIQSEKLSDPLICAHDILHSDVIKNKQAWPFLSAVFLHIQPIQDITSTDSFTSAKTLASHDFTFGTVQNMNVYMVVFSTVMLSRLGLSC